MLLKEINREIDKLTKPFVGNKSDIKDNISFMLSVAYNEISIQKDYIDNLKLELNSTKEEFTLYKKSYNYVTRMLSNLIKKRDEKIAQLTKELEELKATIK